MSRVFLTPIDLAQSELQNAVVQNLPVAPVAPTPKKGQLYFSTGDNTLYWYDGTAWQAAKSGVPAAHASTHNFGGGDAIAANGAVGTPTLRKLGTGATDAAAGDHGHLLTGSEITGTLPATKGGTGNNVGYAQGAVVYANSTSSIASNTPGTSGQMLLSGGTGAPTWANVPVTLPPADGDKGDITVSSSGTAWAIDAGVITLAKMAADSVDSSKIVNGSVAYVDLNADTKDLAVGTASMRRLVGGTAVTGHASDIPMNLITAPAADVAWNSKKITGLADPSSAQDAATKAYVDSVAQGLDVKPSVRVMSTTLVGGTVGGGQTVDGVVLNNNDRVLINNGTLATNGIYTVNTGGTWGRASDFDSWAEVPGAFVFVEEGTTQADTGWVSTADAGGTLGTTAITWTQFSGAGSIIDGAALLKTGNTLDVQVDGSSLEITADKLNVKAGGITSAMLATAVNTSIAASNVSAWKQGSSVVSGATKFDFYDTAFDVSLQSTSDARVTLWTFGTSQRGVVPASGGGSLNFLRADGFWAAPVGVLRTAQANSAASTTTVVNHAFSTRDVQVQVYRNSTPWDTVECDVERTDINNVTVRFAVAPAANAFRILVTG